MLQVGDACGEDSAFSIGTSAGAVADAQEGGVPFEDVSTAELLITGWGGTRCGPFIFLSIAEVGGTGSDLIGP